MKAIKYQRYGSADVVEVCQIEIPQPRANEILIRVHEVVVTPSDIASRSGSPPLIRLFNGLLRPRSIPGTDLAGIVEEIGSEVTQFAVGDRVFGSTAPHEGAHAEYICLPEDGVVTRLPDDMQFAATAGLADAAMTALTFLRDEAKLQPGQQVLINGASGAIGTVAVQLARHFGAEVTGVSSAKNFGLVQAMGAHHLIDYTTEDFTAASEAYDVIFDVVAKRSFNDCKEALKPGGIYLTTYPSLRVMAQMIWTAKVGSKRAKFAAAGLSTNREKLDTLMALLTNGTIKSVVDRRYPLEQMADAHRYVETGRKTGNVVVTLGSGAH